MANLVLRMSPLIWIHRLKYQYTTTLIKKLFFSQQITRSRCLSTTANIASDSHKLKKQNRSAQMETAIKESPAAEAKPSLIVEMLMENSESVEASVNSEKQEFDEKMKRLEEMLYESEEYNNEQSEEEATDEDVNISDGPEQAEDSPQERHYVEEIVLDQDADNTVLPLDQTRRSKSGANEDLSQLVSDVPCPGCGALLHCHDPSIPGYMFRDKYNSIPREELSTHFCHRCHLMRNYNEALALSVDPQLYVKILSKIRHIQALTILLLDVTDIEGSLIKNLPSLIGRKRPMFIIGNKVDLLPEDSKGYLKHVKDILEGVCQREGFYDQMYVHYVGLISAKTGYGVEELITKLFRFWSRRGHVFLLGCTNVGKSSLFNMLLSSDYCKASSRDLIHRATTSVWPGTTLNLLKFPIMAPDKATIQQRVKRLISERKRKHEEEKLREKRGSPTRVLPLYESVGQTVLSKRDAILEEHNKSVHGYLGATYTYNTFKETVTECQLSQDKLRHEVFGEKEIFNEAVYAESKWCHDTPGLVNPEQMINILNQKELSLVVPKLPITPRNFVIKPGIVMFLSGLGRLDYFMGDGVIYLTVYACKKLPIHTVPYETADDFYREHIGTDTFMVPVGDDERLMRLPSLVAHQFVIRGNGWKQSSVDIVLSSLGWISVTTGYKVTANVRAYTPGGRGCYLRSPPLLRYGVLQKGPRIGGTFAYKLPRSKAKQKKMDDFIYE